MTNHFTPEIRTMKNDPETATMLFLGLSVMVSRDDETGQLYVSIQGDNMRPYDIDAEGSPKMLVLLHEYEAYNNKGYGDTVPREHVEKAAREAGVTIKNGVLVPLPDHRGNV